MDLPSAVKGYYFVYLELADGSQNLGFDDSSHSSISIMMVFKPSNYAWINNGKFDSVQLSASDISIFEKITLLLC